MGDIGHVILRKSRAPAFGVSFIHIRPVLADGFKDLCVQYLHGHSPKEDSKRMPLMDFMTPR